MSTDNSAVPLLRPVPPTFRQRIRAALPDGVAPKFDELCAWVDDVLEALNLASAAADRMAEFLEGIERTLPVVADHIEENYPGRAIQLRVLADQSRKEARGADA